ncbi:sensor histidine kinase, partial [Listeria monocytogenes]|nr:sensor histidine kinase [Listeria monocytogenes]HAC1806460.1 sensor histidine kinase [Listeria monocytogenes]
MLAIKWMNKVRTRISWKIFLIFVSIILLFTALVYAMLIFFLPQFYYDYKIKQINDYANEVVKAGEADDIEGVEKALNDFMENTNILPILIDSNGNIVYIPNVNMASIKSATSTVVDGTKAEGGTTATDYSGGTETKNKPISINGQTYNLTYTINIQKINDISTV